MHAHSPAVPAQLADTGSRDYVNQQGKRLMMGCVSLAVILNEVGDGWLPTPAWLHHVALSLSLPVSIYTSGVLFFFFF